MKYLVLIFLIGCQAPQIKDQEQCSPFFFYEEGTLNEERSTCTCRMYRWNEGYVGPIGTVTSYELKKCNRVVGHLPDGWLTVAKWYEEMRVYLSRKKPNERAN